MDTDDDFELPPPPESQSRRLRTALRRARLSLSNPRHNSFTQELGLRFPFAAQSSDSSGASKSLPTTKRKKLAPWKVIPCCVEGPQCQRVPTRGNLDRLCKMGLGVLWFTKDDSLELQTYLTSEELHFVMLCLYPLLQGLPYEFCKAAGPGNTVLISLPIDDQRRKPVVGAPFIPYFTPDKLKRCIGRKGKLYIRPLQAIDTTSLSLKPEHEVYTPKSAIPCIQCSVVLPLCEIGDHKYTCSALLASQSQVSGSTSTLLPSQPPVPGSSSSGSLLSQPPVSGSSSSGSLPSQPPVPGSSSGSLPSQPPVPGSSSGSLPSQLLVPGSLADSGSENELFSPPTYPQISAAASVLPVATPLPVPVVEISSDDDPPQALESSNESAARTICQQDAAYRKSVQIDQSKDRRQLLEQQQEGERVREDLVDELDRRRTEMRVKEWHQRIRRDLASLLPPEPPCGIAEGISIRLRLPGGSRLTRRFLNYHLLKDLYNFVGSQESVNPRHFRLLVNEGPKPEVLMAGVMDKKLKDAGFGRYTSVVVENDVVETPPASPTVVPDSSISDGHIERVPSDDEVSEVPSSTSERMVLRTAIQFDKLRQEIRNEFIEICHVKVNRLTLFDDLIEKYRQLPITAEIRVTFQNERGVGRGVTRELFSAFWQCASNKVLEGSVAKVPVLSPENVGLYYQLGRIFSHGFMLTGYLPLFFAKSFMLSLISTAPAVGNEIVFESFLDFIDPSESAAVNKCLTSEEPCEEYESIVIPMLSRFKSQRLPSQKDHRDVLLKIANFTMVSQPYFAITEMKRGIFEAHPSLWKKCNKDIVLQMYELLTPTPQRVLEMITEPVFNCSSEETIFDYLRRFILSLSQDSLGRFLRFVTANPQCGLQKITIIFHADDKEFASSPRAHTCPMILSMPKSWATLTFAAFVRQFTAILENHALWSFDSI